MAWFKKKKEAELKEKPKKPEGFSELPELPELPKLLELPSLPSAKTKLLELPETSKAVLGFEAPETPDTKYLPSFPGSIGEEFSQEAVKSAVAPPPKEGEKRTLEIAEWESSTLPSRMPKEISMPIPKTSKKSGLTLELPSIIETKLTRKIEPVYIRIDKFKQAIQNFEEIKSRILEIESLLSKIRGMKNKEDEELREWEREIEIIKARVDSIDNNIFSKLD